MPDIYDYFGIIFYFWTDEHDPIHVHVEHQGMGCVVYLWKSGKIEIRHQKGMRHLPSKTSKTSKTLNTIERFVRLKQDRIRQKWADYHVFGKRFKTERITRRIV